MVGTIVLNVDRYRFGHENMEDGFEWTPRGRKDKHDLERCFT